MKFTMAVLASMLAAIIISGCAEEEQQVEILRPVRYQTVYATGGERSRTFSGIAQAGQESRLSFKVSGNIRRIDAKVGDVVKAGKLIAELDPSDYQLQVQQAEASLESAKAQERNANATYERTRQLYEGRNASRNDLDASRAAFESATAQVRALQKQLALARSQLSYTRLKAPVDGAIASVDAEVNENVQTGQTVVQLSSGARTEVQIAIPEMLIAGIREGQTVDVRVDALPGKSLKARVTEVGVTSTGFATTFPVTVRLEQEADKVRPGMAAEVSFRFESGDEKERFLVPPVAVGEDRMGRFVYIVEPHEEPSVGIVYRRAVTIGELTENGIEIYDGLIDGNRVVTAGVSKLSDSTRVKFVAQNDQ